MTLASAVNVTAGYGMAQEHVAGFEAVSLDASSAYPPSRFDRKFLVPVAALGTLMQDLHTTCAEGQGWQVLEVGGHRIVEYRTAYFDTPCLQLYRDHRQGRRRRFKIRTRRYSTGAHMLEIKLKGSRGMTEKLRRVRADGACRLALEHAEHDWLHDSLQEHLLCPAPQPLSATAQTVYSRICFFGPDNARLTIDLDLAVADSTVGAVQRPISVNPGVAIVESKSTRQNTRMDRQLRRLARHPDRLSKYGVALALTRGVDCNRWLPALRRLGSARPLAGQGDACGHG